MRKSTIRVVEVRAGGMWRKVAVTETDAQIHAKVNGLYAEAEAGCQRARGLLDIWLALERELCPQGREALRGAA